MRTPHKPHTSVAHFTGDNPTPETTKPTTGNPTLAALAKRNSARKATRESLATMLGAWNPTSTISWRYGQADLLQRALEGGSVPHTTWTP